MRWNSTTSCAIWHGDDGGVYARELYSHPDGAENDYDVLIENLAEAPEHAALVEQLHARVVAKNGGCLAKNPNKPKLVWSPVADPRARKLVWELAVRVPGSPVPTPSLEPTPPQRR